MSSLKKVRQAKAKKALVEAVRSMKQAGSLEGSLQELGQLLREAIQNYERLNKEMERRHEVYVQLFAALSGTDRQDILDLESRILKALNDEETYDDDLAQATGEETSDPL